MIKNFVAAISLFGMSAAFAAPIELVQDGSFESGSLGGAWTASCAPSCTAANAWAVLSSAPGSNSTRVSNPTDGVFAAYMNNSGANGTRFELKQSIVIPQRIDTALLSWQVSDKSLYNNLAEKSFSVTLAGINVFAQATSHHDANVAWTAFNVDLGAMLQQYAGQSVDLIFSHLSTGRNNGYARFGLDSVSVSATLAPVPLPGTHIMFLSALIGMSTIRRRRSVFALDR